MKNKVNKFIGALQAAVAAAQTQPNKELTVRLLLKPEQIPGEGWFVETQQDMATSAFNKGKPEIVRAKSIKSTTSRRQFKNSSNAKSVIVEIMPLANADDATNWAASAEERTKRTMSRLADLKVFEGIEGVEAGGSDLVTVFQYSFLKPQGMRFSTVVSASVGSIVVKVTCTNFGEPWNIEGVLAIAQAQIEEVKTFEKNPPN